MSEYHSISISALINPGGVDSTAAGNPSAKEAIIEVDDEELEGLDEEEQMQKLLGFGGFDITKGKKIQDNHDSLAKGSAAKNKARKYRQYISSLDILLMLVIVHWILLICECKRGIYALIRLI